MAAPMAQQTPFRETKISEGGLFLFVSMVTELFACFYIVKTSVARRLPFFSFSRHGAVNLLPGNSANRADKYLRVKSLYFRRHGLDMGVEGIYLI